MIPTIDGIPFKLLGDEPVAVHTIWSDETQRFSVCVAQVEIATAAPRDLPIVQAAVSSTVERLARLVPVEQRHAMATPQ